MAIYRKTVRVGQFAKKNEDYKDGSVITIKGEGVKTVGQFGEQDIFKCEMENGEERSMSFNKTSINNMIDAYGEDSKNWIGEKVKVWLILQNVQGKMVRVAYVSHPRADIDDEGNFVLPAGVGSGEVNQVVDDEDDSREVEF